MDKVNADQNMKIEYNLYARMENDQVVDLVMPDSDGVLRAREPVGNGWFAVKWPVDPHFTGRPGIMHMLDATFSHRTPLEVTS